MHSFQHSRARILFEVACTFGVSASCVWAWMQTYASAFLPAAAITALYGLVHAFDMVRRRPAESVKTAATATGQGDLLVHLEAGESEIVADEKPQFSQPPTEVVAKTEPKRKRKSPRRDAAPEAKPEVVAEEPAPEVEAVQEPVPEVAEVRPAMHVVDTAPDETEYVPATPLFEPEPFLRQQRAAFGRKAR